MAETDNYVVFPRNVKKVYICLGIYSLEQPDRFSIIICGGRKMNTRSGMARVAMEEGLLIV